MDNPKEMVIDRGGHILFVKYNNAIVGTCALVNFGDGKYELSKMAIDTSVQGLGLGKKLGNAVIERAKELNANLVFLESNTKLKPAINLYRKLGFKEIPREDSPYDRANIYMELEL